MKAVGIRELKARLSQYLREVEAGEIVLVTDRGRVIAEVRAPGATGVNEGPLDRALRRLAETGALIVGEAHDPARYAPSPIPSPDGLAAELLSEDREER